MPVHASAAGLDFAHLQPWTTQALAARAPAGITARVDGDPGDGRVIFSNTAGDKLTVCEYVNGTTSGWNWGQGDDSGELETEAELDELLDGLDHDVTAGRRCSIGHSGTRRLSAYSSREKRFVCDGCSTYYSRATVVAGASTFPSAHPGVTRGL